MKIMDKVRKRAEEELACRLYDECSKISDEYHIDPQIVGDIVIRISKILLTPIVVK